MLTEKLQMIQRVPTVLQHPVSPIAKIYIGVLHLSHFMNQELYSSINQSPYLFKYMKILLFPFFIPGYQP